MPLRFKPFMPYRISLLLSIVLIVPIGYVARFSQGWISDSLHDALGSLAYEVFWILLVQFFYPKTSPLRTAVGVCLATCAIEVLQLWQPPFLQAVRATLPGRLILGNTFMWSDFPPYGLGSALGWMWITVLRRLRTAA
jgi:hypothetical protein